MNKQSPGIQKAMGPACHWESRSFKSEEGVLVATDQSQEWLLSWWWEGYSAHNTMPVAFVDYGMSEEARQWCRQRGQVIPLPSLSFELPLLPSTSEQLGWEGSYGPSYSRIRREWFKKPFACLQSPFRTTVWMDLDCEVLAPIQELLSFVETEASLCLASEHQMEHLPLSDPQKIFNSGVLVFRKGCPLISEWAKACLSHSHEYWSDDRILSALLRERTEGIVLLPAIYNWRIAQGIPFHAKIIHWCGEWGKQFIQKQGGLKEKIKEFSKIFSR